MFHLQGSLALLMVSSLVVGEVWDQAGQEQPHPRLQKRVKIFMLLNLCEIFEKKEGYAHLQSEHGPGVL